MGQFYNPKRGAAWNYGGNKWKLSRSKIDLFVECPRCFYVDNKLGTKRPPGFPLTLNVAVDELLKIEFDTHRAAKTPHPLMVENNIDAIPFAHKDIDEWRYNFGGVVYRDPETNMIISGAIDDVWVNPQGELIVVDYKATSKDEEVDHLDPENNSLHAQYKRQMEVYQWLLRKNGFDVSDIGYFVYANGDKSKEAFNARLEFRMTVIPCKGDDSWVDGTIKEIHTCLESQKIPSVGRDCDFCVYRQTVGQLLQARMGKPAAQEKKKPTKNEKERPSGTGSLF